MKRKYVVVGGVRLAWADILKARREQKAEEQKRQLALFELKQDTRPETQKRASDRYQNPSLFEK